MQSIPFLYFATCSSPIALAASFFLPSYPLSVPVPSTSSTSSSSLSPILFGAGLFPSSSPPSSPSLCQPSSSFFSIYSPHLLKPCPLCATANKEAPQKILRTLMTMDYENESRGYDGMLLLPPLPSLFPYVFYTNFLSLFFSLFFFLARDTRTAGEFFFSKQATNFHSRP